MLILNTPLTQGGGIFPRPGLKPQTPVLWQPSTSNVLTALLILPHRPKRMDFGENCSEYMYVQCVSYTQGQQF